MKRTTFFLLVLAMFTCQSFAQDEEKMLQTKPDSSGNTFCCTHRTSLAGFKNL